MTEKTKTEEQNSNSSVGDTLTPTLTPTSMFLNWFMSRPKYQTGLVAAIITQVSWVRGKPNIYANAHFPKLSEYLQGDRTLYYLHSCLLYTSPSPRD